MTIQGRSSRRSRTRQSRASYTPWRNAPTFWLIAHRVVAFPGLID